MDTKHPKKPNKKLKTADWKRIIGIIKAVIQLIVEIKKLF